jgi:quercetin dioxygenase-like cupin family protein
MIGTTTRSPRWLRMLAVGSPTNGRTTMEAASGWGAVFEKGDEGRFSGDVWLRSGPAAMDGTNVGVVHFSPGSRTHWHAHPGGQFLYGLTGRGRVRSRGGPGHALEPGDIVHVPAGEWHFHGGAPDSPVVHVAVNGGGAPEWGDPVTDQDYGEGF